MEVNRFARIIGVDFILDNIAAHETSVRYVDHVPRDFHLKRTQPESALPRRAGSIELVKHCDPPATQISAKPAREIPKAEIGTPRI